MGSSGGDNPDLRTGVAGAQEVVRTPHHLPGHADRLPVGIEIEPVGELTVPVLTGVRVDGTEAIPLCGVDVGEDRPHPLGRFGDRKIPRQARCGVDAVHGDGDREP